MGQSVGLSVSLGGSAIVCCVHDRQKRVVTTEKQVAELGLAAGRLYDPAQHKIHRCACCDNLFVDPTDIPRFCTPCQQPLVHALGGPLPDPIGAVA